MKNKIVLAFLKLNLFLVQSCIFYLLWIEVTQIFFPLENVKDLFLVLIATFIVLFMWESTIKIVDELLFGKPGFQPPFSRRKFPWKK